MFCSKTSEQFQCESFGMVHLNGQDSNQLLDTLEEWGRELEAYLAVPEPDL